MGEERQECLVIVTLREGLLEDRLNMFAFHTVMLTSSSSQIMSRTRRDSTYRTFCAWNCVVDTGVEKDDVVAIWGAGPIGQMCAEFAFMNGASRVIMIDQNWRLDYVKSKYPKVELLDYSALPRGTSVTSKLKEMVDGRGPDVALECVAGEYAKGWAHYFELMLGMETDTSEIVNEMITSVRNFGRCGITGVYVGFVSAAELL